MDIKSKEGDKARVDFNILKSAIKQRLNYIKSKPRVTDEEVYVLVKDFFKEFLKLDYEFTHEELIEELEERYLENDLHQKLVIFIKRIGKVEYCDENLSQQELRALLNEFEELLKILLQGDLIIKLNSALKKLGFGKSNNENNESVEEINDMNDLIERIKYYIISEDLMEAKKLYFQLKKLYDFSLPEKQHKYYQEISNLYYALKPKGK